jgi:hypothetical protein
MAKRQTVEVAKLKRMANEYFANSGGPFKDARRAIQSFVEAVLHDTGNYRGFQYLTAEQSKPGHSTGVIHDFETGKHVFPDESRIYFL